MFEALILFLVFGLHVLNALKAFLSALELLLAALDLVFELSLVLAQLLDSFLHFAHFALLRINDVADALLDVLLLAVRVQIT